MATSYSLFDLPENDTPRERLIAFGASVLSNSELLSIILRSGGKGLPVDTLSSGILNEFSGFKGLVDADIYSLIEYPHLGKAKATAIKAACEIGLRISMDIPSPKRLLTNSGDLYKLVRKRLFRKSKEHLYMVSVDSRMKFKSLDLISIGTANETIVHPRDIFKIAFLKEAVSIMLVHNHPSNDPNPSSYDIDFTSKIYEAGKTVGIRLVDHLIACDHEFYSFKDNGYLSSTSFDRKEVKK